MQHARETDVWWKRGVIYQIYPRSFQDSGDDGIGDIAGIERRLEHGAELVVVGLRDRIIAVVVALSAADR